MPYLKQEADVYPRNLFELTGDARRWWVLYVRSRQEKLFARHLGEHKVPFYLPQQERRAVRAGRQRSSFLPLFPGYVFLYADDRERLVAVRRPQVVSLLEVQDQGTLAEELASLWSLQQSGGTLIPHPYLEPGDEVRVIEGPLRGFCGKVLREAGRYRLVVSISLLRQSVAAEFAREVLAPIRFAEADHLSHRRQRLAS